MRKIRNGTFQQEPIENKDNMVIIRVTHPDTIIRYDGIVFSESELHSVRVAESDLIAAGWVRKQEGGTDR